MDAFVAHSNVLSFSRGIMGKHMRLLQKESLFNVYFGLKRGKLNHGCTKFSINRGWPCWFREPALLNKASLRACSDDVESQGGQDRFHCRYLEIQSEHPSTHPS